MYLAYNHTGSGTISYSIRMSYHDRESDMYRHRQVFELGPDPTRYIRTISDHAVCFDEELEDALRCQLYSDPTFILEKLLWNYLPREERERIRKFPRRDNVKLSKLDEQELKEVERSVHIFDRRRLYYIRYGAVDQSRIFRLPAKLYRPLLFKSRDEKEYYFKDLELSLPSTELKKYVYVIFNLQQGFSESFAAFMPEALDQQRVDELFEEKICRLNQDASFWQGEDTSPFLNHHLQGYVSRYFDYEYASRSFAKDFYREFRAKHRSFKWPERNKKVSDEAVSEIFGETVESLKKMPSRDLTRLFRKKAKEFHPDSGGNAEQFIQLLTAYEQLKK